MLWVLCALCVLVVGEAVGQDTADDVSPISVELKCLLQGDLHAIAFSFIRMEIRSHYG